MKLLVLFVVLVPQICLADSEVACDEGCPSGQTLISYADGNNTSCTCANEATMDATVPNPDVDTGAIAVDQ